MTLLEDIQNSAVDRNGDLATILRKCKVLAARLGSGPLEDWVILESDGYPETSEVPDYRKWPLTLRGHFLGPFGSQLRCAEIPVVFVPKKDRDGYLNYRCRQSVACIETALAAASGGTVHVTTGDLAVSLGANVYQNYNCVQVWAEFGSGCLVELLNSVRNRILNFSLALGKESPTAGEIGHQGSSIVTPAKITQIFNTSIHGGNANIVGSAINSSLDFISLTGDFGALARLLAERGVIESDVQELQSALKSEPTIASASSLGPRVSNWIGKMVGKAASGVWHISVGTAADLLARAIAGYYGF